MKLKLVKNGIFPITHTKEGTKLERLPETGHPISGTLQGEGKYAGTPSIFIRTSGCNLRCWVEDGSKKYHPVVVPVSGSQARLKDVKIGETILALNNSGEIVKTQVVGKREDNDITEYFQIKLKEHGDIYVTGEHQFLTVDGWVRASELKENQILIHLKSNEIRKFKSLEFPNRPSDSERMKSSERMKINNPIFNSKTKDKIYNNENYKKTRSKSGKLSSISRKEKNINWKTYLSQDEIDYINFINSERMKGSNPMKDQEIVLKKLTTEGKNYYKKTNPELLFESIITDLRLNDDIWFTGHSGFFVRGEHKIRVPDFKIHNTNKLIEVTVPNYYRSDFEKYKHETELFYKKSGFNVLVLNMNDQKEDLKKKILSFVHNGIEIKSVKKIIPKNSVSSYNIQCEPYENYLINKNHEYLVSHNCTWKMKDGGIDICDTPYSSHNALKFTDWEIDDIVSVVKQNIGNMHHVVITGGEPMYQAPAVAELAKKLKKELDIVLTIETNGTIFNKEVAKYVDFYSISPKLADSVPTLHKLEKFFASTSDGFHKNEYQIAMADTHRVNTKVIQSFIDMCYDSILGFIPKRNQKHDFQLKFVVSGADQEVENIKHEYLKKLKGFNPDDIILMPVGSTAKVLEKTAHATAELAIKNGWVYTPRLQVDLYGNLPGV